MNGNRSALSETPWEIATEMVNTHVLSYQKLHIHIFKYIPIDRHTYIYIYHMYCICTCSSYLSQTLGEWYGCGFRCGRVTVSTCRVRGKVDLAPCRKTERPCFLRCFLYWCVLRRERMGCWGLLGWWNYECDDDYGSFPKIPCVLSTSKFLNRCRKWRYLIIDTFDTKAIFWLVGT